MSATDTRVPQPQGAPVVVALAQSAEQEAASGRLDQAANALERALRIEPQNPFLWHRLAGVRLRQHRPQDAIDLATRSITLTADKALIAENWELIAQSYELQGDADNAQEATRQVNKYR